MTAMPLIKSATEPFRAQVMTVTPDWAKTALKLHDDFAGETPLNRHVSPLRVSMYARMMREGLWHLNGEAIQFAGARLMNGQHRLQAVIEANVNVPMLIVTGVPDAAFDTIDQGRPRSAADLLSIHGHGNRSTLAAGARLALDYMRLGTTQPKIGGAATSEVVRFVMQEPEAWTDCAAKAMNLLHAAKIRTTPTCAWLYLSSAFPAERERFYEALRTGANLSADRPVKLLRDRCMSLHATRTVTPTNMLFALFIKAWNAELAGRSMRLLTWKNTEEYPVMVR